LKTVRVHLEQEIRSKIASSRGGIVWHLSTVSRLIPSPQAKTAGFNSQIASTCSFCLARVAPVSNPIPREDFVE